MADENEEPAPAPQPLDYRGPADPDAPPTVPVVAQAALGFLTWVAAVGACAWLLWLIDPRDLAAMVWIALGVGVAALWFGEWLRVERRWRGFLPGMLLGLLLTCLVPIGIVAVVCGPGGGRL